MKNSATLIDDLAKLAGGAAGIAGSLQQQIRNDIRARVEEMATRMDLVPREDFDRIEALLNKALAEQENLKARLEKLESKRK